MNKTKDPSANGGSFCYNKRMPSDTFDEIDARLLEIIQREFPLIPRPFDAIADMLEITSADVMERISRLKQEHVIRQISAIFDSAALGYSSTLAAFRVQPEKLDNVAEAVAAHTGVSHCYSRDSQYNLWFTMTLGPGGDLGREIDALSRAEGVKAHIILPSLRVFKIGVFFDLGGLGIDSFGAKNEPRRIQSTKERNSERESFAFTPEDILSVRVLQNDLPIIDAPFAELAREAGMTEEELLSNATHFLQISVMRRYAAVLRHQRVGYRANAMVCWQVEPDQTEMIGSILAEHPAVSHCYQRAIVPNWPYPLYTMIHCRNEEELDRTIAELTASSGVSHYEVLRTAKEYKKSRVVYF